MTMRRVLLAVAATLALTLPAGAEAHKGGKRHKDGHRLFLQQAKESKDLSEVRLPLFRGTDASGDTVRFIVTDVSSRKWAKAFGANYSAKLGNAAGTGATMRVSWGPSGPVFPFSPDFSPPTIVVPGAPGSTTCAPGTSPSRVIDDLPVECSAPGATGSNGQSLVTATGATSYSPLVEIATPDGPVVFNAPHIANSTGQQGRALRLRDTDEFIGKVDFVLTAGLYKNRTIHYITTDSSIPILAALEDTTFAPALNRTPSTPTNDTVAGTTRSGLSPITNGATGLGNPDRQGITSAIVDGPSTALNIIQFTPDDEDASGETLYSPMWDIHLATWKPGFDKVRQNSFAGLFTNPGIEPADGVGALHPVVFWTVNCPIVSTDEEGTFKIPPPT